MRRKIIAICIVLVMSSISAGFMFYNAEKPKWQGDFPVVNIFTFIDPLLFSNSDVLIWENEIVQSGKELLLMGNSKIALKNTALDQANLSPWEYNPKACQEKSKRIITLYAQNSLDPDCTASSCSFIWSCGNEITSATIQFNYASFSWANNVTIGFQNIRKELMHNIGHVLGLNHCLTGEKNCSDGLDSGSVMYRFMDANSEILGSEDIAGLQDLYGKFQMPFPTDGKYSILPDEVETVLSALQIFQTSDENTDRAEEASSYKRFAAFSEKKYDMTIDAQLDDFFNKITASLVGKSVEELNLFKKMNIIAIMIAERWIQDYNTGKIIPMDIGLINKSKDKHVNMRKQIIDMMGQ